ncbi:ABC transporter ATP-binding protein [bacterium]|nr:ABC transporter ATP-binding protein [bacterium]
MPEVRVVFDDVWKKFRRGERARALRDLWPSWMRTLQGKNPASTESLQRDEFYSLKGVSFEVPAGECLGIIGPNGAGKSTILKCASRILRPNRGHIRVNGRVSALIEVGAGFHPDLTGKENVFLNGTILGMKRSEIADRFDQIVDFAGLADFIHTPVKRYSSGMYARLGFAVSAFMEPDVLLIDEVLSVGDLAFARKCEKKIKEICSGDTTVLFISHNLAAVRSICNRVIVLAGGEVRFDGPPDQAILMHHDLTTGPCNEQSGWHPDIAQLRFTLRDAIGAPTASAEPGGVMTVDAELVAKNPIREASIGFFLRDANDTELYSCTMESLGTEPIDLAAGDAMRIRFRIAVNLIPGEYWIGSMLHGRPSSEHKQSGRLCFEHTPNRAHLTVAGGAEIGGCANLFASCDLSTEPAAAVPASLLR